jgi:hypothetical protein
MLFGMQLKRSWILIAATSLMLGAYMMPVFAEEEMTIDEYIDVARPFLHHSCESAWAASGENADKYVEMINGFVAIVFINHDFNIQRIADAPEADQEKLQVLFYDEIGKRCKEDPQKLLAGVVERSLVFAFDEMK